MRRLHRWGMSRRKLRGGFLHSKLGDRILERELWFPSRGSLARAWLVGMPITTIPFLPVQTVFASILGFRFRANLPVCFALQYISNPATLVPHFSSCYFVGKLLMGESPGTVVTHAKQLAHGIVNAPSIWAAITSLGLQEFAALYLGAIVIGFGLGLLGYGLTHAIWREKPPRGRPKQDAAVQDNQVQA